MQVKFAVRVAAQSIASKLQQASQMLAQASSMQETVDICNVIGVCGTTLQALQPLL